VNIDHARQNGLVEEFKCGEERFADLLYSAIVSNPYFNSRFEAFASPSPKSFDDLSSEIFH
jgi:hypothetical protein